MAKQDSEWGRVTIEDLENILASLPKPDIKKGDLKYWMHESGSYFHPGVTSGTLETLKTWRVREDDIFLVTFPKAGTTWMQEFLRLIYRADDIESGKKIERHVFMEVPFLEFSWIFHPDQLDIVPPSHVVLDSVPSPRLIKSHLESTFLPPILTDRSKTNVKIIYVARNPKDLVVSYYCFLDGLYALPESTPFSESLQDFLTNKAYGGDWFKENLYWWNRRHDPNVLFVKYEDMHRDLRSIIIQVCDFLKRPLSDKIIDQISERTTFKSMKDNPFSNPDATRLFNDTTKSFMRKGQIGDWKNYFTVAENDNFDTLYRQKMANSGLTFDFGE